jgi:G3E family GTPase
MVMQITLVSSLDALCRQQACDLLADANSEAVVMLHDLLEDGLLVRRTFRPGAPARRAKTVLQHPCPSCAIRLAIAPAVHRARDEGVEHLILALPPALPAAAVVQALADAPRRLLMLNAVVLACAPGAVEDQVWDRHTLFESGYLALPHDERTPGEFLMDELAATHTVLLADPDMVPTDPCTRDRGIQLLKELAPHAHITDQATDIGLSPGRRAAPDGCDTGADSTGDASRRPRSGLGSPFTTLRHRLHRPLHPERFHQALHTLAAGCCRLRGQLWMAPAPECRILLKGAGPRVWLENTGPWPAYQDHAPRAIHAGRVDLTDPAAQRSLGQPGTVIEATGEDLDTAEVTRLLTDAQLTDAELSAGIITLADPFGLDTTHDIDHRRTP